MRRPRRCCSGTIRGASSWPDFRAGVADQAGERIRFLDLHRHRERARALGKRRDRRIVLQPREVFLGRQQIEPALLGLRAAARARPSRCSDDGRGKPRRTGASIPACARVAKNFSGSPMPANARNLPAAQRCDRAGIGRERAVKHRQAARLRRRSRSPMRLRRRSAARKRARAAVRAARASGPGGDHPAIADAARIDHEDRKVLDQRRVLKSVVHHDDARARVPWRAARPDTRSSATTVGATRASSSGSSPTCAAVCAGSTITGPASRPP